ncbi:MAG: dTMP kinase, partial [Acidimicrobiales bacterium]
MRQARGRLVALEGGEASGKSTQAALLAQALGAVLTREPGGTALGERVRDLLLDPGGPPLDPRAEALLMLADRAQHVATVVAPALAAGRWVVTDRYTGSTLAYQGHGRGLVVEELGRLAAWATGGLSADLTVLLDVAPGVARRRRDGPPDRLEGEGGGFHTRVLTGYRALAAGDPAGWAVVGGEGGVE